MNEKDDDVAEQLREAIRASGQSLTQLGKGCGIDSARMSRFMTGKRGLSFETMADLAELLGLKLWLKLGPADAGEPAKPPARRRKGK